MEGIGGNAKQKRLKVFLGPGVTLRSAAMREEHIRNVQARCDKRGIGLLIHKYLNLLGNYLSSQFESREMGRGVP